MGKGAHSMNAENLEMFPPDTVAMDSPKLAWLKRHGVTVIKHNFAGTDIEGSDEPTFEACGWHSWTDKCGRDHETQNGWGYDEDEALQNLAKHCGWKLWNEENV